MAEIVIHGSWFVTGGTEALVVSAFRRPFATHDSRFTIDLARHAVRRVLQPASGGMNAVLDGERLNGSIAVAIEVEGVTVLNGRAVLDVKHQAECPLSHAAAQVQAP